MASIHLTITPEVIRRFPEVVVGGVLVEEINSAAPQVDGDQLLQCANEQLQHDNITMATLTSTPVISDWRNAILACGLKPSTFLSSPEALARRLLKGNGIHTPLPVVDAYCAISARHLAPLGGYDVDRLPSTSFELREGRPKSDAFEPLGGRASDMPITNNVVVYALGDEVVCFAFNVRDSRRTCLTSETRRAVFFSEAVSLAQQDRMNAALADLAAVLAGYGGRVGEVVTANATSPSLSL